MSIDTHARNRAWAFEAMDRLDAFLDDPDFEGDAAEERESIARRRKELKDGKYRVVFLGAFNVGKSALINALLGDEYLPMILEECTTKITHVVRAPSMKTVLTLSTAASEQEIEILRRVLDTRGIGARVLREEGGTIVTITYRGETSKALLKSLHALITMNAEEDFPQLKALRDKFEEIFVHVPSDFLPEDVALVDSPGVRTINETNERISHGLIPRSHLVVCLIDSQNAGHEQTREFIDTVIKHYNRKVFFVINKSDQLNPVEIDPNGRRGPAKDLYRCLHGIVSDLELFFVSSLYALVAAQLRHGRLGLAEIDQDQKIKIPLGMMRELVAQPDPVPEMADYLMARSELEAFKTRLLEYLYHENREGAVLDSVCRFLDDKAWKLVRPLEIKLELARDIPRLEELRVEREGLLADIEATRAASRKAIETFRAMSGGGEYEGKRFEGYEAIVRSRLGQDEIESRVIAPVEEWLDDARNLADAKRAGFEPLSGMLGRTLDAFAADASRRIGGMMEAMETDVAGRFSAVLGEARPAAPAALECKRGPVGEIRCGLGTTYLDFAVGGIILGAAAGAAAGSVPAVAEAVGWARGSMTGAGALIGALAGLVLRALTGKGVLRERLLGRVRERVGILVAREAAPGKANGDLSVLDQLNQAAARRREAFSAALAACFDKVLAGQTARLEAIRAEEEDLRRQQEEIISRLEPKVAELSEVGKKAHEISTRDHQHPAPEGAEADVAAAVS